MIRSYYTLYHIVSGLRAILTGKQIESIFTQERDRMILKAEECPSLIISCRPGMSLTYLDPRFARARRNTTDVLKDAIGKTISELRIDQNDRVLRFELGNSWRLEGRLYGSNANVYLVENGEVRDSFRKSRVETGNPPIESEGKTAFEYVPLDPQNFTPSAQVSKIIKEAYPMWGAVLAKEAIHRASLPGSIGWKDLSDNDVTDLGETVEQLLQELKTPSPRIYNDAHGSPVTFSIIPLRQYDGLDVKCFDDIHQAIRMFIGRARRTDRAESEQDGLLKRLKTDQSKTNRTIGVVEKDLASSNRAEEYRLCGSLILANISGIKKGSSHAEVSTGTEIVRIPLHTGLTPSANAQRYFNKAKKAQTAKKEASERLSLLKEKQERISALVQLLGSVRDSEDYKSFIKANEESLGSLNLLPRGAGRKAPPFRVFVVDGGFEVWAGKNSKNNDELTLKHATPHDFWFHARGGSGSHVILRVRSAKGEPGKRALHQAASIAAYFSKMKNSRVVPVAMTRKKYVKKPRGAPPGTVSLQREETILAEPKLPASTN